jgi:cobalamin biosynthetic protein CobC
MITSGGEDPRLLDADQELFHGGDLGAARRLFPGAPEPFIDLSTGINPFPYPLPPLDPAVFARLPAPAALECLAAIVAAAYGAPSAAHVVAGAGVQSLLPHVFALAPPGGAAVLGPTYAEHARVAALAGHRVREAADVAGLAGADLAILVNPNNPDGRRIARQELLALADALAPGLLVVDEAFVDVALPDTSLAPDVSRPNLVVLRSFGKFFGLAGLRLGFALAAPKLARELRAMLGPWAVSGPAIHIGATALADEAWQDATRAQLEQAAQRLDALLIDAGLALVGGTSLYRLTRSDDAEALFDHLGRAGIMIRRFASDAAWLRWGLPKDEEQWRRLTAALAKYR